MPFQFQQYEPLERGVRRIAESELADAIRDLEASGPGEAQRVHSVRKHTKKLRALLRLVRGSLGEQLYRADNASIREAARALADARRGSVLVRSFDTLVARYAEHVAPQAFERLRELLVSAGSAGARAQASTEQRAHSAVLLRDVLRRVGEWRLEPEGFRLIEPGLRDTYRRARADSERAFKLATDEAMHDFRKRAKDHWYHVRLLQPCWPAPLEAVASELHDLTELLGDDHDLADLRAAIIADPERIQGEPAGALLALLERRQHELRQAARPLAARLFAERPKTLVHRLRVWFDAWQAEPPSRNVRKPDEVGDPADDLRIAQDTHVTQAPRLD